MSGLLQISDAYITGFLDLVGQWVKDYYDRSQLPQGYEIIYNVTNNSHGETNLYVLHFDLYRVGHVLADIGSIDIEANTIITQDNLPDARFGYIRKKLQGDSIDWDFLHDEPLQFATLELRSFDTEH